MSLGATHYRRAVPLSFEVGAQTTKRRKVNRGQSVRTSTGSDMFQANWRNLNDGIYHHISYRRLVAAFFEKLPRELRDMVYRLMFPSDGMRVYKYQVADGNTAELGSEAPLKLTEPYWKRDVVGDAMRSELIDTFYRCSTFIFEPTIILLRSPGDSSFISKFLTTDQCQLGYSPNKVVSSVWFRIRKPPGSRTFGDTSPYDYKSEMAGLLHLRKKTTISIEFVDFHGETTTEPIQATHAFKTTVDNAYPMLKELKTKGHMLELQFSLGSWSENYTLDLQKVDFSVDAWFEDFEQFIVQVLSLPTYGCWHTRLRKADVFRLETTAYLSALSPPVI